MAAEPDGIEILTLLLRFRDEVLAETERGRVSCLTILSKYVGSFADVTQRFGPVRAGEYPPAQDDA